AWRLGVFRDGGIARRSGEIHVDFRHSGIESIVELVVLHQGRSLLPGARLIIRGPVAGRRGGRDRLILPAGLIIGEVVLKIVLERSAKLVIEMCDEIGRMLGLIGSGIVGGSLWRWLVRIDRLGRLVIVFRRNLVRLGGDIFGKSGLVD